MEGQEPHKDPSGVGKSPKLSLAGDMAAILDGLGLSFFVFLRWSSQPERRDDDIPKPRLQGRRGVVEEELLGVDRHHLASRVLGKLTVWSTVYAGLFPRKDSWLAAVLIT